MNATSLFNALPAALQEQVRKWRVRKKSTPLESRLYIYSIVLDPFLFFVILDRLTVGFSLTASRGFQLAFYAVLLLRFVWLKKQFDIPALKKYWDFFLLFLIYSVFVYSLAIFFDFNFILKNQAGETDTSTAFAEFISGAKVRPFIEFFVLLLTAFHYFWFGPRMIKTREHYQFLCSTFLLVCYISLAIGFINFLCALLLGQNLMPRHLVEYLYAEPSFSGARFQGLAGEPRDAFGQLTLFLVVFYFLLKTGTIDLNNNKSKAIIMLSIAALALTLSASGMVSFAMFIGMYIAYDLWTRFTPKKIMIAITALLFGIGLAILSVTYVERFALYVETFSDILVLIEGVDELPPLLLTQLNNFYPLIHWFKSCLGADLNVCFFGGGLGTSFALNSQFYTEGLNNPHSYISRLLPELGIVGMGFFICLFLNPVFKQLSKVSRRLSQFNPSIVRLIKISLLALLASVLGHKSNNLYFGLLIVVMGLHFYDRKACEHQVKSPTGNLLHA